MKIHYALMSCDDNPMYKDFIPVITKAWNKIGIKPVFVIITNDGTGYIESSDAIKIYFRPIEGIKISFQALNARIWAWKELEGNCILSDIDMMPLSSEYFNGIAKQFEEHQIVSYCDDAIEKFGQIASCYILANSSVMGNLIKEKTWEDFIQNRADETGQGWGGDQWYLGEIMNKHKDTVRLRRGFNEAGQAHNRLDRDSWNYNPMDISDGRIYDSHLLRPYLSHKDEINKLLEFIK